MGNIQFTIGGHKTHAIFRVLPLGMYEGIIRMDWLVKHKAILECHSEKLKFQGDRNQEAKIFSNRGNPALHLILATKIFKHYPKNQRIYGVKLNPID